MGSVNKVILVGNLGRDAELRFTQGGTPVAKFSIACTETWTKDGNKNERTEWFNVDVWGKQAERLAEYLTKGKQIYVEGKLQTDKYTDREGVKRTATKVRADRVALLSGGSNNGRRTARDDEPQQASQDEPARQGDEPDPLDDSDIPF